MKIQTKKGAGLLLLFFSILFIYSCKKDSMKEINSDPVYSVSEIKSIFDKKKPIKWKTEKDAKFIYSVGMQTDSIFAVGYRPAHLGDISDKLHTFDFQSSEWKSIVNELLSILTEEENVSGESISFAMKGIPAIILRVTSITTIEKLLNHEDVTYVYPMNTTLFDSSTSSLSSADPRNSILCSCDGDPPGPVAFEDYTPMDNLTSLGVKRPWNFDVQNINESTWNISSGAGIGVAIIDTGVSYNQENLETLPPTGTFNSGYSMGRTEHRQNFLPSSSSTIVNIINLLKNPARPISAHDQCGHGTKMAGFLAAPRGEDGNSLGVAYNCNLYNLRAVHDPLINSALEQIAVASALEYAANQSGIKIISMSIGMAPGATSAIIEDAIDIASNMGKMIICAAGTAQIGSSWANIVFPANLENTIAVTGIQHFGPEPSPEPLTACSDCFSGPEVNFAVFMERKRNEVTKKSVTLTCTDDQPIYGGGSSCATATFAGMAAMVWADQGASTERSDILDILEDSANNPLSTPNFGHGWVDMVSALQ